MKKFISIFLLICILSGTAITASAAENQYTHTTSNISIITPDSFESAFSVKRISKVSYDYLIVSPEGASNVAVVALQMELKIAGELYTVSVSGTVNGYELPSGDILWEGPISTTAEIADKDFTVTAGFTKLESSEDVLISVTLQNDAYDPIAFSFGKNIIKGEVLDLFKERASSSTESASTASLEAGSTSASSEGNASTNGMSPRTPSKDLVFDNFFDQGGSEYPNLGENGEYVFQSIQHVNHAKATYSAVETRVYWDKGKGHLMVTLKPYDEDTNAYVNTLGYDFAGASLSYFDVELILNGKLDSNHAEIAGVITGNSAKAQSETCSFNQLLIEQIFVDAVSCFGVPTGTWELLLNNLKGRMIITNNLTDIFVQVYTTSGSYLLDDFTPGVPLKFSLYYKNSLYEGNTPYVVNTTAKYFVLAQTNVFLSDPVYYRFYIEETTTHSGNISLVK